jgi:hypothetical protein
LAAVLAVVSGMASWLESVSPLVWHLVTAMRSRSALAWAPRLAAVCEVVSASVPALACCRWAARLGQMKRVAR